MDNNLKRGPKPPRGRRSKGKEAERALRFAGMKGTAFAQAKISKAHAELDKRTSKVDALEATVVRQAVKVRAVAGKLREVRAQVSTARPLSALSRTHPPTPSCAVKHTRLAHATTSTLVHLHLHLEQAPREIQHVSYCTAQMALDLKILHSKMEHSIPTGKLIAELPAVHRLMAKLKEAKDGTTEARDIHNKIKGHLFSMGFRLIEAKVEHAQMAHAVKCNADAIHSHSKYIGEL